MPALRPPVPAANAAIRRATPMIGGFARSEAATWPRESTTWSRRPAVSEDRSPDAG